MSPYAGIIGTGANAAMWYYHALQQMAQRAMGENAVFPIKLLGIPFEPINNLLPQNMMEAGNLMQPYLKEMEKMGAAQYILANITLHEALDKQKIKPKKMIHIRDVFNQYWERSDKNVMIIGSGYTMSAGYIPSLLPKVTRVIRASEEDEKSIDMLRRRFYHEQTATDPEDTLLQLPAKYPEVDTFIISCTEHALALKRYNIEDKFFNLPLLQCQSLFQVIKASLETS